jgi:hypothetical protein
MPIGDPGGPDLQVQFGIKRFVTTPTGVDLPDLMGLNVFPQQLSRSETGKNTPPADGGGSQVHSPCFNPTVKNAKSAEDGINRGRN